MITIPDTFPLCLYEFKVTHMLNHPRMVRVTELSPYNLSIKASRNLTEDEIKGVFVKFYDPQAIIKWNMRKSMDDLLKRYIYFGA